MRYGLFLLGSTIMFLCYGYAMATHQTVGTICRGSGQAIATMASRDYGADSPTIVDSLRYRIRELGDGIETACTPGEH